MRNKIVSIIKDSLLSISHPRFFESERGYQGQFLSEIRMRLPSQSWAEGAILEQEYQKRLDAHGLRIRPDLILHTPFIPDRNESRRENNFVVIELKRAANKKKALDDYENLSAMCDILNYPLAVFINIGAKNTFLSEYRGPNLDKMVAFSVILDEKPIIRMDVVP